MVIAKKKIAGLSSASLERFVLRARRAAHLRGTVDVLIGGNRELRSLNRRFRGKDKPTDVLSFPSIENGHSPATAGELAISLDMAKINAAKLGHPVAQEIKILVLHGILHLAGFDHDRDHGEMAVEEIRLRKQLSLEAGLIERAHGHSRKRELRPRKRIPAVRSTA